MRIAVRLFLCVVYVSRVVDTGSGVCIWPLIDDSGVVNHQYTATPQERPGYQRAHKTTHTVREVKGLGMNMIWQLRKTYTRKKPSTKTVYFDVIFAEVYADKKRTLKRRDQH